MDHAVCRFDVSCNNSRAAYDDCSARRVDGNHHAGSGFCFECLTDQVGGHHFARYDVVGEDGGQGAQTFFSEQSFDGAFWQCRERIVGWCEYGERAFGLQYVYQTSSPYSSNQRVERASFTACPVSPSCRWRKRWLLGRKIRQRGNSGGGNLLEVSNRISLCRGGAPETHLGEFWYLLRQNGHTNHSGVRFCYPKQGRN